MSFRFSTVLVRRLICMCIYSHAVLLFWVDCRVMIYEVFVEL